MANKLWSGDTKLWSVAGAVRNAEGKVEFARPKDAFVLMPTKCKHALKALKTYVESISTDYPDEAKKLQKWIDEINKQNN